MSIVALQNGIVYVFLRLMSLGAVFVACPIVKIKSVDLMDVEGLVGNVLKVKAVWKGNVYHVDVGLWNVGKAHAEKTVGNVNQGLHA